MNQRVTADVEDERRLITVAATEPTAAWLTLGRVDVEGQRLVVSPSAAAEVIGCSGSASEPCRVFTAAARFGPTLHYVLGPVAPADRESVHQLEKGPLADRPEAAWIADKAEMREMAAIAGGVSQPYHKRIGAIAQAQPHLLQFAHIDFNALPLRDMASTSREASVVIFETLQTGFVVEVDHGLCQVRSEHPLVRQALNLREGSRAAYDIDELSAALRALTESAYVVDHFSRHNPSLTFDVVLQVLAREDDGTYFLKDARGSRANNVVKVEIRRGEVVAVGVPRTVQREFDKAAGAHGSSPTPEEYLRFALGSKGPIARPLLERAIPTEMVGGVWTEQRLVFHFDGPPHYLMAYSKLGNELNGDLVPNRSQGGTAEPIRTSFRRILEARAGSFAGTLEAAVEETAQRMKEQGQAFARRFSEEAKTRRYFYGPIFAIDLCPIWNDERRRIEFQLLEIQDVPFTDGAVGNIPPDEQAALDAFNRRAQELFSWRGLRQ